MKKKKQREVAYERLNRTIQKDNVLNKDVEEMLVKDLNGLLNSYFVYQNGDFRYLFIDDIDAQEFVINLKYKRVKDIKILW